jgi:hypothetical protein
MVVFDVIRRDATHIFAARVRLAQQCVTSVDSDTGILAVDLRQGRDLGVDAYSVACRQTHAFCPDGEVNLSNGFQGRTRRQTDGPTARQTAHTGSAGSGARRHLRVLLAAGCLVGLAVQTDAIGERSIVIPHIEEGDVKLWMRYYEAERGWKPSVEEPRQENPRPDTREPDSLSTHEQACESDGGAQSDARD